MGAEEEYGSAWFKELTPPGKQLDRALEFADTIAANAPLGVAFASARQAISGEDPPWLHCCQPSGRFCRARTPRRRGARCRNTPAAYSKDGKTAAAGNPEDGRTCE